MNVKYELQLLNLGFGNINTWRHFLPHVMAEAELVSHPDMFNENKIIIVPGIGHFDDAMSRINASGFAPILSDPMTKAMGVCLGYQVFFTSCEEGVLPGLNRFEGHFTELPQTNIGWQCLNGRCEDEYYFLHRYALFTTPSNCTVEKSSDIVAITRAERFTGFQFHPERSNKFGVDLFIKELERLENG